VSSNIIIKEIELWAEGMAQEVKPLPSKREAQSSNAITALKKKKLNL
jgi:hypothetical protein